MLTPRVLRRRIKSVQSTAKITKAMEMVATAKMKKAQDQAVAGRPYAEKIVRVIADLSASLSVDESPHPLLNRRKINRIAIVHITTDRGLCGGLNANMNRFVANFIYEQKVPVSLITVGRKGRDFMVRYGREVRAEFTQMTDTPKLLDTLPISRIIIDDCINGYADLVYLAYPRFMSTVTQKPVLEALLPVEPAKLPPAANLEYIYEPNSEKVLSELLPRFVQMEVYHAILEAIASEHSARMVAMRNATDSANDLISDLTVMLNKARQEMITKELLDITSGAEAITA